MEDTDIDNRFEFHQAPNEEKVMSHASARMACRGLAVHLNKLLPEGREKSLAITHLEETMFWANAALARDKQDS